MSLICTKCGELLGPVTQGVGGSCVCGGRFEEIDEEILKAFMPFAPASPAAPTHRAARWGWLAKMVGQDSMRQVAAMSPEQRVAVIANLRRAAIASGVQAAHYAGADFSAAEGAELLR